MSSHEVTSDQDPSTLGQTTLLPAHQARSGIKGTGQKALPSNPWITGSFYLAVFVVAILTLSLVAYFVSPFVLSLIIVGGLLALASVGALQLRHDEHLGEEPFLRLMIHAFRYLPRLNKSHQIVDCSECCGEELMECSHRRRPEPEEAGPMCVRGWPTCSGRTFRRARHAKDLGSSVQSLLSRLLLRWSGGGDHSTSDASEGEGVEK